MTGNLQTKNNKYYAVINLYENGKRKQKWICTGYTVKGNWTKANKFLREKLAYYESREGIVNSDILFSEYVKIWLEEAKKTVDEVTYQGYELLATSHIIPYFESKRTPLQKIDKNLIQNYINEKAEKGRLDGKGGLSTRSLKLHKNIINQTLKEALKNGLIAVNPCQFVTLPAINRREPTFYTAKQVDKLLSLSYEDSLYLLLKITATYGLRRSEVLGLQWNSINFETDTIQIAHTVVKVKTVVKKDKTKNKSSYRTFPLIPEIKELLLIEHARQENNRREFKSAYINSPYIFVWPDGRPFSPDYVSHHFEKIIKTNNLPYLRFHDLRHSCASILLSRGFTLKDVQEWLGHSDIKMTANVYGHLDIERKKSIAETLASAF